MDYKALLDHQVYKQSGKLVLFCNQAAYDHSGHVYLFDLIIKDKKLLRILQPEHGLFAAVQDQDSIENEYYHGVPCVSMYDKNKGITGPEHSMLEGADALIIDIQDAGVRYFTYTTHMFGLLAFTMINYPSLHVIILDRENPSGRKIEGTPLPASYKSFLGSEGMIHRHGMSTRELCRWFLEKQGLMGTVHYLPVSTAKNNHLYISPSPNLPVLESLQVYPGQCFWEATTFSEGRGTTRPFTLFGHPDMSFDGASQIAIRFNNHFKSLAYLRPTKFIPVFHKHAHQVCTGWQLHVSDPEKYHSILGSLWIMREVNQLWEGSGFWRPGPYEFDSSCTAAELLIGDDDLIGYVNGNIQPDDIADKLSINEAVWKTTTAPVR